MNPDTLAWVALVITAIGLVATVNGVRKTSKQTEDLKAISESISTKFLSTYPDYVPHITRLLQKAQRRVEVLCDVPAYCVFSNYDFWVDYGNALKKAFATTHSAKDNYAAWLSDARIQTLMSEQFPNDPSQKDAWKQGVEKRLLDRFLTRHNTERGTPLTEATIDYATFSTLLNQDNEGAKESFRDVKTQRVDAPVTLMYWIVDNTEAVFAVSGIKQRSLGQGFYTSDQKLIDALRESGKSLGLMIN